MIDRQTQIDLLLDHYEQPRNRGRIEDADSIETGGNPTCGDVLTMYVKYADPDRLERVQFEGEGCTLSIAAASIVSELATGRCLREVKHLDSNELIELLGREIVMTRSFCATLALRTLQASLRQPRG
jgi:nitrogen fixation NifU-like protein